MTATNSMLSEQEARDEYKRAIYHARYVGDPERRKQEMWACALLYQIIQMHRQQREALARFAKMEYYEAHTISDALSGLRSASRTNIDPTFESH